MIDTKKFPPVKGKLRENVPLDRRTFFGVGGSARVVFEPADIDDLAFFLRYVPDDVDVIPLGAMSNVLISSEGIDGIVIMLGDWFKQIYVEENTLEVGAGVTCSELALTAMDHELGGLEFLTGLPGTIGGAIKMNAGCFGSEVFDILTECETITTAGRVKWFRAKDVDAKYRNSGIPDDCIITRAWFRGMQHPDYSIYKKANSILEKRKATQPLGIRSCGSVFKNPKGAKAWELVDKAGCRGLKVGGAQISEKHCNFIVNEGSATSEDIENLGELVRQKVFEKTGVKLEWEIVRLGYRKTEA